MSEHRASIMQHLKRNVTVIVIALMVPLLLSFIVFMAGNAFGYTPASINYGLPITSACSTGTGSSTVVYFWCSGSSGTGPFMVIGIINLLNDIIYLAVFIVVAIVTINLLGKATETSED